MNIKWECYVLQIELIKRILITLFIVGKGIWLNILIYIKV